MVYVYKVSYFTKPLIAAYILVIISVSDTLIILHPNSNN